MLIAKCHLARIKKYVDISEKPNKHVTTYSCYLFYRQERDETRTPRTLDDIAVFECENQHVCSTDDVTSYVEWKTDIWQTNTKRINFILTFYYRANRHNNGPRLQISSKLRSGQWSGPRSLPDVPYQKTKTVHYINQVKSIRNSVRVRVD